ncbi:MAG: RyR domain-containing protein [Eubacteriales bacterium]
MTYKPKPIDTSNVILKSEISELIEFLAENVHEVWAQQRISQGWSYGASRDENLKQTPCLVPYKELPEIEKEYDRSTALETLKLITALGYTITKS